MLASGKKSFNYRMTSSESAIESGRSARAPPLGIR